MQLTQDQLQALKEHRELCSKAEARGVCVPKFGDSSTPPYRWKIAGNSGGGTPEADILRAKKGVGLI